jgi:hypothetical protein
MVAQVGYSVVGWRCVQSVPYTLTRRARVSWLSLKTMINSLSVVWPQNHWDGFLGLALKSVATVSWLSLKTKVVEGFLALTSELAATVW